MSRWRLPGPVREALMKCEGLSAFDFHFNTSTLFFGYGTYNNDAREQVSGLPKRDAAFIAFAYENMRSILLCVQDLNRENEELREKVKELEAQIPVPNPIQKRFNDAEKEVRRDLERTDTV